MALPLLYKNDVMIIIHGFSQTKTHLEGGVVYNCLFARQAFYFTRQYSSFLVDALPQRVDHVHDHLRRQC